MCTAKPFEAQSCATTDMADVTQLLKFEERPNAADRGRSKFWRRFEGLAVALRNRPQEAYRLGLILFEVAANQRNPDGTKKGTHRNWRQGLGEQTMQEVCAIWDSADG